MRFTAANRKLVFFFPALFLALSLAIYFLNAELYFKLFGVLETGFFEWVQLFAYLVAAYVGGKTVLALRSRQASLPIILLICVFALGCLFIAMEEISWGQRIFHWQTPTELQEINYQGETNFHNLYSFQNGPIPSIIFFGILLIGCFGWLFRIRAKVGGVRDFVFPDWYLTSYFAPMIGQWILANETGGVGINHQEFFETLLSLGFAFVALANLEKSRAWSG